MSDTQLPADAAYEQVLQFDTPESVVFGYRVAGIGSRFLAALVDTTLIVVLQVVVNLTLFLLVATLAGQSLLEFGESRGAGLLAGIFGLVAFAFLWGYYIFFELLWNGQSPGKRLAGLRVIQQNGAPIDIAAALIRNLVRIIDFLPLYYGVGVLTMFIDRQSRRLGDFAAGTIVIYDRGAVTLQELARETAHLDRSLSIAPLDEFREAGDLAGYRPQPEHVLLARAYLSRQDDLFNRGPLAVYLARRVLEEGGVAQPLLDEARAVGFLKKIAAPEAGAAVETNGDDGALSF